MVNLIQVREERNAEYQRAFDEHQRQLKIIQREKNESEANGNEDSGNDEDNDDDDGEWEGFAEPPPVDYEAEYIDEDKYTTVTVEEMDPSREGLLRSGKQESDHGSDQEEGGQQTQQTSANTGSKSLGKKSQNADKTKKKKKKFRYESKDERKLNEAKIRLSKAKRAKARRGEQ